MPLKKRCRHSCLSDINIFLAHKQFLGHPGHRSSRPGTRFLPPRYPDENVYVPCVPHTAHKLLTPGHRSGKTPPPTRSGDPPPPPGQSPEKFVYVYVPFPFLIFWGAEIGSFWEGFWEGFWGRVLRRVLRRGSAMGFTVKNGSEKGSQKGFWEWGFQKVPRTAPWRVRPLRRAP